MRSLHSTLPLALSAVLVLAACSKKEEAPAAAPEPAVEPAAPVAEPAAELKSAPAPEGAKVFFVDLKDGAEVTSPFLVTFGAEGIEVAAAGEDKPNSGHHHLIIDGEVAPADAPIPADEHYQHFGKGQTETMLELPAGTHTLQLEFGNYAHVPFNPPLVSDKITITVK